MDILPIIEVSQTKPKKCPQILHQGETKIKHGTSSAILHDIALIIISPCILPSANIFSDTIWMNTVIITRADYRPLTYRVYVHAHRLQGNMSAKA